MGRVDLRNTPFCVHKSVRFKPVGFNARGWARHSYSNQVIQTAGTGAQGACAPNLLNETAPQDPTTLGNGQAEQLWNIGMPMRLQLAFWNPRHHQSRDLVYGNCHDKDKSPPTNWEL